MKGQGKLNLAKNLHTVINVTRFKHTYTNICRCIQCAKVADSFGADEKLNEDKE